MLVQTEFAVEMTCESCVNDISNVLKQFPGMLYLLLVDMVMILKIWYDVDIKKYDINLEDQRVVVEGSSMCMIRIQAINSLTYTHSGTIEDISCSERNWKNSDCAWTRCC